MRIALYQPDIPQNTGAIFRLAACFGLGVDIIEPCGFVLDDRKLRRVGMDYVPQVDLVRHASWEHFQSASTGRLVLCSTKSSTTFWDFSFRNDDVLLMGRESAGVPQSVHGQVSDRVLIPMEAGTRSLNVAMSAAIIAGEALRQTRTAN